MQGRGARADMDTQENATAGEIRAEALIEIRKAVLHPPAWCKVTMATERFLIRTFRIAVGIVLVRIAFWLFAIGIETLDEPFASLTPLALLGGILAGVGGLIVLVLAFGMAFGEKGDSRIEAAWRRHRVESLEVKLKKKLLGYEE